MKVIVFKESHGEYDSSYEAIEAAFLVEDDFDIELAKKQWDEETSSPAMVKNQYGTFPTRKYRHTNSMTFLAWISKKFQAIDVIEEWAT